MLSRYQADVEIAIEVLEELNKNFQPDIQYIELDEQPELIRALECVKRLLYYCVVSNGAGKCKASKCCRNKYPMNDEG